MRVNWVQIPSYANSNVLLPENFAFKLVSARRTEARGLDERTLWANIR